MSEFVRPREVAIVFRRGDQLVVPPVRIEREPIGAYETNEQAAYRLATDHGLHPSIDVALNPPKGAGIPDYTYLMVDYDDALARSELLIPYDQLPEYLSRYSSLSSVDQALLLTAHALLSRRHDSRQTRLQQVDWPEKLARRSPYRQTA